MTQALNLALFANKLNTSGQTDNTGLQNSTISGTSLGSNLPTLTIGTGLSGTSYNGTSAVTIANSGVTSVNGSTGAVTIAAGGNTQFSLALRTSAVNSNGTPLVYSGTAGTLTFTAPTGVTRVKVTLFGGGGAGGAGAVSGGDVWFGGTGGNGGYAKGIYTVVAGTAYTITVGVGGTANGGAGGTSSFTTLISATGGAGATSASIGDHGVNGASGVGSSGNLRNRTGNNEIDIYNGSFVAAGTTAAQIWNASSIYGAGAGGFGGGEFGNGGGGVSGMVLIEYVG